MLTDKPNGEVRFGCCNSFAGMLTILFIGLKLTGFIDWSWIWVLAPLWATTGLGIVVALLLVLLWIKAIVR